MGEQTIGGVALFDIHARKAAQYLLSQEICGDEGWDVLGYTVVKYPKSRASHNSEYDLNNQCESTIPLQRRIHWMLCFKGSIYISSWAEYRWCKSV